MFTEAVESTDLKEFDVLDAGLRRPPGSFLPRIDLQQYTGIDVGSEGRGTDDRTASVRRTTPSTSSRQTPNFVGEFRTSGRFRARAAAPTGIRF